MKSIVRLSIHLAGNLIRYIRTLFLQLSGVKIGKGTMISLGAKIDTRRGTIDIGRNCLITHGCYVLSHDGAAHVLNHNDNGSGCVVIGDNVFVGVNSVILRNVKIGDNCVIGAGSVVTADIPSGMIAVGSPAKVVGKIPDVSIKLPRRH